MSAESSHLSLIAAVLDAAHDVVDLSRPQWPNEFWYGVRAREMRGLVAALAALEEAEDE